MSTSKPKTVFITGASSGLGYYLAIEFAKRGYKVFAGARNLSKLKALEQYGVTIYAFDITNSESIYKVKELIAEETGDELDILYNNAGIANRAPIFDLDIQDFRHTFDVNVFGHVEVIQAFHKLILNTKGLVVFTDSTMDLAPIPFASAYAASKSAFHQIGRVLALEVNRLGIKVLQVRTGRVLTDIGNYEEDKVSPDSIYYLEDQDVMDVTIDFGQKVEVYAKNVVNDVETAIKSGTLYKTVYRGEQASVAYYLNLLLPFTFWGWAIFKFLKIDIDFDRIRQKLEKPKTS